MNYTSLSSSWEDSTLVAIVGLFDNNWQCPLSSKLDEGSRVEGKRFILVLNRAPTLECNSAKGKTSSSKTISIDM
jgi:hypothetical protein